MNLVEWIKNQIFSNVNLDQLSGLVGAGEGATKSAVGTAVPALLSALSDVASGAGASKLASAVGRFDAGSVGEMLSKAPAAVAEQGSGLLNSLFSGNAISGIVNSIARSVGIGTAGVQKLLGYILPLVLGAIAGRFAGKAVSAQGLTSLFAEQKANITNALPSGFSLGDVPGVAAAGSAVRSAAEGTQQAASSAMKWLLPLLGLAALALVLWLVFRNRGKPDVPDVAKVSGDLTGSVTTLTETLDGIKDPASAEAAVPKLEELNGKLDDLKALVDKLPDAGKTKIAEVVKSSLGKVGDKFADLMWVPGVGEKIRPAAEKALGKLAALGGVPVPEKAQVSSDLASTFTSLTKELKGVTDSDSAEEALPRLERIQKKLDDVQPAWDKLPEDSKSALSSKVKSALKKLRGLVESVVMVDGVGARFKSVVNGILKKLDSLVA